MVVIMSTAVERKSIFDFKDSILLLFSKEIEFHQMLSDYLSLTIVCYLDSIMLLKSLRQKKKKYHSCCRLS